MSSHHRFVPVGALALALAVAAGCNRSEAPEPATSSVDETDATAELERERADEIARLRDRVAELEREYAEAAQEVSSGAKTATAGLREELKEDVTAVREAVDGLASTTPENWWDRHEEALNQTVADIETDVRRLAGKIEPVREDATGTIGSASNEPFTSRRDAFVTRLRSRVDAMEKALENIDARGARETEVEDTRARMSKLREDLDGLNSAQADDWWELSRNRVTEDIDRVEGSVDRLDDNEAP
jgi:hypothetical protein